MYTDHGTGWTAIEKIPLIMHFPFDQYNGTILENTQNLDIAPTILDYLGIQKPDWMEGASLLNELGPYRLILAAIKGENHISPGNEFLIEQEIETPGYQLSEISIIQCQNWYIYHLKDFDMTKGIVANYSNPCSTATLYTEESIQKELGLLLTQLGYDLPDDW